VTLLHFDQNNLESASFRSRSLNMRVSASLWAATWTNQLLAYEVRSSWFLCELGTHMDKSNQKYKFKGEYGASVDYLPNDLQRP
jgi:hypothetical protein